MAAITKFGPIWAPGLAGLGPRSHKLFPYHHKTLVMNLVPTEWYNCFVVSTYERYQQVSLSLTTPSEFAKGGAIFLCVFFLHNMTT